MERVVRPTGLSALGVISLVFGGSQALGLLFTLLAAGLATGIGARAMVGEPGGIEVLSAISGAGLSGCLIASGVGCLRMRRMGGQILSNVYVFLVVIRLFLRQGETTLFTIIGLVYPVILALFVNLVFRDIWRTRSPVRVEDSERPTGQGAFGRLVLIAIHSLRQILRSAGGVLLCMSTLIICLFLAQIVLLPLQLFDGAMNDWGIGGGVGTLETEALAAPLVERLLGWAPGSVSPGQWTDFLLSQRPGMLSLLCVLLVYVVPTLMIFASFHQVSSDSRRHGLRYLLLRAGRAEIYLGKLLASVMVAALLLLVVTLTVLLYTHLAVGRYALSEVVGWSARAALALMLLSLPFVALGIGCSGLTDSGIANLGIGLGIVVVFPLLVRLLQNRVSAPLGMLGHLVPYRVAMLLLHPTWWVVALAALACLAYGGAYLGLGLTAFRRRSL